MKKKALIVLIFGVLLLLFGILISLFIGMNEESSDLKNIAADINNSFTKFEEAIEKFNGERKIYNEEVVNNLYIEEVTDNYSDWILIIDNYKNSVIEIKKYGTFLKDNCFLDSYVNSNVQSKCNSMNNSYETVINYFVKDINRFNELLEVYNEKVSDEEKVKLYDLGDMNYIDFNDDGKYKGYDN